MKHVAYILITLLCLSVLAGCGNKELIVSYEDEIASLKSTVESLTKEKDELGEKIETLESEKTTLQTSIDSLTDELSGVNAELDAYKEAEENARKEKEIQVGDVTVLLTNKGEIPRDSSKWIFSDYVTFEFTITNNTAKDIQGIQGTAKFMDLFGEKIISIGCDFTGQVIPAGGTIVVDDLTFDVNEFMSNHTKLYTTAYNDLKFEYQTTAIVFTDGTTKTDIR